MSTSPAPPVQLADALSRYYSDHGLPMDGGAGSSRFHVHLGRFTIPVWNPPARRRAVFFHDANHVLAGYDTTFSRGEVTIAAFEVGTGCGPYLIAWAINLPMMVLGLALRPRDVFRAFVRGRHARSIYREPAPRESLERMTVAELRARLGLDGAPPRASAADVVAFAGWSIVTLVGIVLLSASLTVVVWWVARSLLLSGRTPAAAILARSA